MQIKDSKIRTRAWVIVRVAADSTTSESGREQREKQERVKILTRQERRRSDEQQCGSIPGLHTHALLIQEHSVLALPRRASPAVSRTTKGGLYTLRPRACLSQCVCGCVCMRPSQPSLSHYPLTLRAVAVSSCVYVCIYICTRERWCSLISLAASNLSLIWRCKNGRNRERGPTVYDTVDGSGGRYSFHPTMAVVFYVIKRRPRSFTLERAHPHGHSVISRVSV